MVSFILTNKQQSYDHHYNQLWFDMGKRQTTSFKSFSTKLSLIMNLYVMKNRYTIYRAITILNLPLFIGVMYQNRRELRRRVSNSMEWPSELELPIFMRKVLFGLYSRVYDVKTEQMIGDYSDFKTFSEFFTRRVESRQINQELNTVLSPSDSRVLSMGEVNQDSCFVVKGYSYKLGHLVSGKQDFLMDEKEIELLKKDKANKLYHVVLYLAPGDYHRFHSGVEWSIVKRVPIQGFLDSVSQRAIVKQKSTYETNSRFVFHGKWHQGYFGMIFVGAQNVGRIIVRDNLKFAKGEEIGFFNIGSTIVLLIESPQLKWNVSQGQKIRYSQCLAITKMS